MCSTFNVQLDIASTYSRPMVYLDFERPSKRPKCPEHCPNFLEQQLRSAVLFAFRRAQIKVFETSQPICNKLIKIASIFVSRTAEHSYCEMFHSESHSLELPCWTQAMCVYTQFQTVFFSKYEPWTLIFGNNFSSSFARPRFGRGSIKLHVRFGSAFCVGPLNGSSLV